MSKSLNWDRRKRKSKKRGQAKNRRKNAGKVCKFEHTAPFLEESRPVKLAVIYGNKLKGERVDIDA